MRRTSAKVTTKQKQILEFIVATIRAEYRCPTVREIGDAVGLSSTSSVQSHLDRLEADGHIFRDPLKKRSIKVVDMNDRFPVTAETSDAANPSPDAQPSPRSGVSEDYEPAHASLTIDTRPLPPKEIEMPEPFEHRGALLKRVPLLGHVQAGSPITAVENYDGDLTLPISLTGNSECFLLRVQGDSMMDIGMYEDDLLIVRSQSTAYPGDIVVARTEDDEVTVKRFYKEKDRIRLQPENPTYEPIYLKHCAIEGKVIGLIRERV